jgi:hypothetical protein
MVSFNTELCSQFLFPGFALQWIASVASRTISLYIEKISFIPKLSQFGAMQLSVDICMPVVFLIHRLFSAHFFNALKVLGINLPAKHPLEELLTYSSMSNKEYVPCNTLCFKM